MTIDFMLQYNIRVYVKYYTCISNLHLGVVWMTNIFITIQQFEIISVNGF